MPKRVIDFDAMWNSEKLAHCKESCRVEYAWMYGLADANGSFELTSERVVWARISPVRPRLSLKKISECVLEFTRNGLLFVWEQDGKKYGHWTNSDLPGRLPKPSERSRYQIFAPDVPKRKLAEYMSNFSNQNRDTVATTSRLGVGVGVGVGVGEGGGMGSDAVGVNGPAQNAGAGPAQNAGAIPIPEMINRLGKNELKGLRTTLLRSVNDTRLPADFRCICENELVQVDARLKKIGEL